MDERDLRDMLSGHRTPIITSGLSGYRTPSITSIGDPVPQKPTPVPILLFVVGWAVFKEVALAFGV